VDDGEGGEGAARGLDKAAVITSRLKSVRGGTDMPVTNYFLDRYFARGFGDLKKQSLLPVPAHVRSFSVQQFAMNAVFAFKLEEQAMTRSFNAIRRTLYALDEYELARKNYDAIFGTDKRTDAYLLTLHHFEMCIAEAFQAHELVYGLLGQSFPAGEGKEGPEEVLYRLRRIYNTAKHTEGIIKGQSFKEGGTLAVWISNDGLALKECVLTFGELHEILCGLANGASVLAVWGRGMQPSGLAP
jgi:hypothetical protein